MTIIVFLIDNSASMNQRTIQGTTLLDIAKSATELFYKIRLTKSRVDKYIILTLDPDKNYRKLCGWGQNVDLQCLRVALSSIKPEGKVPLGIGLQRAFRMLNVNRIHLAIENYALGMLPSHSESAIVVCITDGIEITRESSFLQDYPIAAVESVIFGRALTDAPFRWDYRLFSIILRYPAFSGDNEINNGLASLQGSPCISLAERSGGKSFIVSDNRELQQSLETIASKCQSFVTVNFTVELEAGSPGSTHKQLLCVRNTTHTSSTWPIPEAFPLDVELSPEALPTRPVHPHLYVSNNQEADPELILMTGIPIDKYDLEPSSFTKFLCKFDPVKIWQCFGQTKDAKRVPCGYLKLSPDLRTVQLHLLPYNYPTFCKLLGDYTLADHVQARFRDQKDMSSSWNANFFNYLNTIPHYYLTAISKAFECAGFFGVIPKEALDGVIPFSLKKALGRLKQFCDGEFESYENFISVDSNILTISLPPPLVPKAFWHLRDIHADSGIRSRNCVLQPYLRVTDIDRRKLRGYLRKMWQHMDSMLTEGFIDRNNDLIHQRPVAAMGDYVNNRVLREEPPLRDLTPSQERLDTFGNPFKRKSNNFVADEFYVDEMGLSTVPGGANAAMLSPTRKKPYNPPIVGKTGYKGPLPPTINHVNWRKFSPKNYLDSPSPVSPESGEPTSMASETAIGERPVCISPTKKPRSTGSAAVKDSSLANEKLVYELLRIVREPLVDGQRIFHRLNELCGTLGQKHAAVSAVMSEALRFKRSKLYHLLKDWCACTLHNGPTATSVPELSQKSGKLSGHAIQINGWG